MSEYTLTPEQEATTSIIEAIKKVWAKEGYITLEGPEIVNAVLDILCNLTDKVRKDEK